MNRNTLFILASTLCLYSCNDELYSEITQRKAIMGNNVSEAHKISKETALNSLYDFLEGEQHLKTAHTLDTSDIIIVKTTTSYNKTSQETDNTELLYIANFENDKGFAILAADDRINEDVLVISDNGTITNEMVSSSVSAYKEDRVIFNEYPLNGDGFITLPEYPNEIFMNPNTVSLYDNIEDDTFVGYYRADDNGEESESNATNNKSSNLNNDDTNLCLTLCLDYAQREIESRSVRTDVLDENGNGGSSNRSKTIETATNWTSTYTTPKNLLSNFRYWHQNSPFNDLYPRRRKFIAFGKRRKVPAGCFPLSIAKIMSFFQHPSSYSYQSDILNWSCLNGEFGFNTTEGRETAAALLFSISESCNSKYFYQGTFTFPRRAISFLEKNGFKNVNKYDYKFYRVKEMIDGGKPVIIFAMPKIKVTDSHAWNIDGYKIKTREITTETYVGNTLTKKETKTETREMVHCDFGWSSKCNGYYVSGIFKLNSSDNDYDKASDTKDVHYNNYIKIITYNK